MSVISVNEKADRRRSSNSGGVTTHTRAFLVVCSDKRDGTAVALTADDGTNRIPRAGDQYRGTTVKSISADPVANSNVHFEVEVESNDANDDNRELHPLDRPAEISWGSSEGTEDYFTDVGDDDEAAKPVVNSASDSFEQFSARERGEMSISITRNEADHDANQADLFSHTMNQDYVTIGTTTFAPKTLKLSPITAAKVTESWQGLEISYFKRTYLLKCKRDGWEEKIIDVGVNEAYTVTEPTGPNGQSRIVKKKRPIVDAVGAPVKKPVALDGQGKVKVLTPEDDQPVSLTFRPYGRKSWHPLNLTVIT